MRCFIALPLADEFRDAMADAWAEAKKPSGIRLVSERQWHVTVAFLGDIAEHRIRDIVRACARCTDAPGAITFSAFETFPRNCPKYVVASGSPEPTFAWRLFVNDLQRQCAPFAPSMDKKPWRSHITLARASSPNTVLAPWSTPVGSWTWIPGGFILYESQLGQDGSQYRTIHEFPFSH